MPLPGFLAPATNIELEPWDSGATARALGGGGRAGAHRLEFAIDPQEQENWCWAATSRSVSRWYDSASAFTQCAIANAALGRNDCCADGASDPTKCNQPWYLDVALQVTGNFHEIVGSALTFPEVRTQIDGNSPLGARIGWFGGGGHFVIIRGWLVSDTGTEYIDVSDPIFLDTQIAYDEFAASYHSGGDWTHSYTTHPAGAGAGMFMAATERRPAELDAIGA